MNKYKELEMHELNEVVGGTTLVNKLEKIAAVFYPYRYWIFFSILFIIGFFGGIAVGLNHINK